MHTFIKQGHIETNLKSGILRKEKTFELILFHIFYESPKLMTILCISTTTSNAHIVFMITFKQMLIWFPLASSQQFINPICNQKNIFIKQLRRMFAPSPGRLSLISLQCLPTAQHHQQVLCSLFNMYQIRHIVHRAGDVYMYRSAP